MDDEPNAASALLDQGSYIAERRSGKVPVNLAKRWRRQAFGFVVLDGLIVKESVARERFGYSVYWPEVYICAVPHDYATIGGSLPDLARPIPGDRSLFDCGVMCCARSVESVLSAVLFLYVGALTSFWVSDAFRYSLFGLMGGCLLGLLGVAFDRWEETPRRCTTRPTAG